MTVLSEVCCPSLGGQSKEGMQPQPVPVAVDQKSFKWTSWLCPSVRTGMRQITHNIVPHVSLHLKTTLSFPLGVISTTELTVEDTNMSVSCSRREMFPNEQINIQKN